MRTKSLLKIFLLMAIVLVGMGCASAGIFDDGDALLGNGEYKVGDDLPAGEYYVNRVLENSSMKLA